MADKDADNFEEIKAKYGPGFDALKKTYIRLILEDDHDGRMSEVLSDTLGSYERFHTVQSAWGFFEALLSIPEASVLQIIAIANEK